MATAVTKTFQLPDTRTIAWCEYGSLRSPHPPIFYFHGSPSSRFEGALYHKHALSLDFRIIAPDRPGIGLSSQRPGRKFLDYPADILALAAHLGIQKFHVLGSSGGCPYTLACLKIIPRNKCLKAQVISGIYPLKLGMDGMRFIQRAAMFISYWSPHLLGILMNYTFGTAARDADPSKLVNLISQHTKTMPARDQEAYEKVDGLMDTMIEAYREAFRQDADADGIAMEFGLWARDWGFELSDLDARALTIWHGTEDGNVGVASARRAAGLLEGCEMKVLEGEGHLVLAFYGEEILKRFLP